MTLRQRIAVWVFLPAALFVTLALMVFSYFGGRDLTLAAEQRFQATTNILSEPVLSALLQRDFAGLDEFLLSMQESPEIIESFVQNNDGVVISADDPRRVGQRLSVTDDFWFSSVIRIGGNDSATLYVQFDNGATERALRDLQGQGLALLSVFFVLAAAFAYWSSQRLAERLFNLSHSTSQFAQGDYSARVEDQHRDEVGQLARDFNNMATTIQNNLKQLHQSEQRVELALSIGSSGIWEYDGETNQLYMDDGLRAARGISLSRPLEFEDLFTGTFEDDLEARMSFIDQVLVNGDSSEQDFRIESASGEVRWVKSYARALIASKDKVRVVGIDQDITSLVHQREQIERLKIELERSNQELDDFAYIASHDLKEPLRGLRNYAEFLKEDYGDQLDETATQYVDRLASLASRMTDMINDLLRMSRVAKIDNQGKRTNTLEQLADLKETLAFQLEEKNADLVIDPDLPDVALDPAACRELFYNLIVNGLKYNRSEQPWVRVSFDAQRRALCFSDNGIGIEADRIAEIFKPFKSLNSRSEFSESTGIGMTIVQKIIQSVHGDIDVTSTPGEGTSFYLKLPLA